MRYEQAWGSMARVTAMTSQAARSVEEVFCSRTRIRILKLLNDLGQLNVSDIARRLGSNYAQMFKNLLVLEESELVIQLRSGRARYYRLNEGCLKVSAVQKVLETWIKEEKNE